LLEDKDANVRAYAADGLGKFGPAAKEAVPALKRLLADMHEVFDLQGCVCNHAGGDSGDTNRLWVFE
jgi:HEAT repeat protein